MTGFVSILSNVGIYIYIYIFWMGKNAGTFIIAISHLSMILTSSG